MNGQIGYGEPAIDAITLAPAAAETCHELNYACQYKRTVKKRGPKPRCQPRSHQAKCSVSTSVRRRTYPSPGSTESGGDPWGDDGASLCTKSGSTENLNSPETPMSTSEICSSSSTHDPWYVDKESFQGLGTQIPSWSYFPLDLSPLAMSSESVTSTLSCRYACLNPVLPLLQGTMTADDACQLLDIFFADPETPGPIKRCPYVLSPVIRRQSLLRHPNPRPVSPALVTIILWCVSHTAKLGIFPDSSARARATQRLYFLSMKLLRARDSDNWRSSVGAGDWVAPSDMLLYGTSVDAGHSAAYGGYPEQTVDDVISYVLLTCVVSGTEFKDECLKWWNKAVRLVKRLGFHSEAQITGNTPSSQQTTLVAREEHEERRRAFWLVYSLDRHLALSSNEPLHILDLECQVLCPLPERVWQRLDNIPWEDIPPRTVGPPIQITGTSFFEYFLPLMTILGDIIDLRSRNQHPRLGGFDESYLTGAIEASLADCEGSLHSLQAVQPSPVISSDEFFLLPNSPSLFEDRALRGNTIDSEPRSAHIAVAYGQYMIQVLHILLHGEWGPLRKGVVDTSCAPPASTAHSIAAGEVIDQILSLDKDLSFIPFVFGTYLFHGSLNFLSLVHQMSRVGAMDLAKQGCEAILRAHDVARKTLDTSPNEHPLMTATPNAAAQVSLMVEKRDTSRGASGRRRDECRHRLQAIQLSFPGQHICSDFSQSAREIWDVAHD
ncbi:fungal-specific transcription factor domain-containing protein [Aspergillus desertorum]